jgi:hypothetical protein
MISKNDKAERGPGPRTRDQRRKNNLSVKSSGVQKEQQRNTIKVHLHRSKRSFVNVNAFVRDIYGYIYMNEWRLLLLKRDCGAFAVKKGAWGVQDYCSEESETCSRKRRYSKQYMDT